MEQRSTSNPSASVNRDSRKSFVFNKARKSSPTKIAQTVEHLSETGGVATEFPIAVRSKIVKTVEQTDKYGPNVPLPKPAREQGRNTLRHPPKTAKTAEQARKIQWLFGLLFLCTLMSPVFAQEKPKAVLVDEFGRIPCDELGARASGLVQEISKTPNSRGLVISYPKTDGRNRAIQQFRQILANFEFAGLEERVDFVLGEERGDAKVELWIVPHGVKEPDYKDEKWTFPKPDLDKPFIYGQEDENGECPTFVTRKFAELLLNNPGSRANIVVRKGGPYSLSALGFADQWVGDLRDKFGISRKQIRVFYGKPSSNLTYAEFWFVPAKNR